MSHKFSNKFPETGFSSSSFGPKSLACWVAIALLAFNVNAQSSKPASRPSKPSQAAAGPKDPQAAVIIEKFIDAMGGRKAFEKVTTRVVKTEFQLIGTDFRGSFELYEERPGRHYMISDSMDGQGTHVAQESGCDGVVVWQSDTMNGFRRLPDDMAKMQRTELQFDAILRWQKDYSSWQHMGEIQHGDRACKVVELTMPHGGRRVWLFDSKTGLRVFIKATEQRGTPRERIIEQEIKDYRQVNGIKSPFLVLIKIKSKAGETSMRYNTKFIRYGLKIDAEKFTVPDPKKKQPQTRPTSRQSK